MKLKVSILLIFCLCILSCKTNFRGKQANYINNNDGFKMVFINDSIFEINPRLNPNEKSIYKYHFLKKEILVTIKENQPSVNFKTKKRYGQFSQKIALERVEGENIYFKKEDTLNYLKMRINSKITKRIYFDDGNKFIEL